MTDRFRPGFGFPASVPNSRRHARVYENVMQVVSLVSRTLGSHNGQWDTTQITLGARPGARSASYVVRVKNISQNATPFFFFYRPSSKPAPRLASSRTEVSRCFGHFPLSGPDRIWNATSSGSKEPPHSKYVACSATALWSFKSLTMVVRWKHVSRILHLQICTWCTPNFVSFLNIVVCLV